MLQVTPTFCIPEEELHWTYARSSGPGGQNVNKVNSKAILHWNIQESPAIPDEVRERFLRTYKSRITTLGQVVLSSERFRDQPRNIEDCREKLVELLTSVWVAPKRRRPTKPTRGSVERRLETKRANSVRKADRRTNQGED